MRLLLLRRTGEDGNKTNEKKNHFEMQTKTKFEQNFFPLRIQ